jgi:hypothetical protein
MHFVVFIKVDFFPFEVTQKKLFMKFKNKKMRRIFLDLFSF